MQSVESKGEAQTNREGYILMSSEETKCEVCKK